MPLLTILGGSTDRAAYAAWLKNAPGASLWQSLEWQGYQEALGRETRLYGLRNASGELAAAALVVIDKTAFGLATWDIPQGPVWTESEVAQALLEGIVADAAREGAMAIFFSPVSQLSTVNYQLSKRHEHPEATVLLDLTQSDEALLARMHPKCRYNIRLAEKHGVKIEASNDVAAFHRILRETSARDGFTPLPRSHYEHFLTDLPGSFLLLAYEGLGAGSEGLGSNGENTTNNPQPLTTSPQSLVRPIAALLGVTWGNRGYYYYGASSYAHRALMAPYLLQWHAMHLCQERGCATYDLLGIVPEFSSSGPSPILKNGMEDPLCQSAQSRSFRLTLLDSLPLGKLGVARSKKTTHPWAGITRFKRQFGGAIVAYPPEQEIVLRPVVRTMLQWKRRWIG